MGAWRLVGFRGVELNYGSVSQPDSVIVARPLLESFLDSGSGSALATTPGEYVLPPLKAEEMYSPEVYGRTASGKLIVD